MKVHKIIRILEHPPKADYYLSPGEGAAVGAIITSPPERVQPLQMTGLFHEPLFFLLIQLMYRLHRAAHHFYQFLGRKGLYVFSVAEE